MIKLICSYPYDNNYDYTRSFNTKEEQKQFFKTFKCIVDEEYNEGNEHGYIKEGESFCVNYNYDYLVTEGVNYIIFNNGYKDIYAFITSKEYLNEDITRLNYEIDVIQTFLFDITLNNSFIERKVCSINEITDFDEGLNIGEHIIESNIKVFDKDATYFAMFNGFKEQQLIFDGNVLKSVVDLPFSTSKPLTVIDDVQYPLYFMPLKNSYKEASYNQINVGGFGETIGGTISAKILRFIKGFEGFSPYPFYHNGESARTGGYGIREDYQSKYFNLLNPIPVSEQNASEVLAQMLNHEFASTLYQRMLRDGLKGSDIKQNHFDAFLSLSMNGGLGAVTSSPMYKKYLNNQDDESIYNDWLNWYIYGENILDGPLPGLVARRKQEATIFKDGIYEYRAISILNENGVITDTLTDNNGHGFIPSTVNGGV
mgnify:CR=1 FL=1